MRPAVSPSPPASPRSKVEEPWNTPGVVNRDDCIVWVELTVAFVCVGVEMADVDGAPDALAWLVGVEWWAC